MVSTRVLKNVTKPAHFKRYENDAYYEDERSSRLQKIEDGYRDITSLNDYTYSKLPSIQGKSYSEIEELIRDLNRDIEDIKDQIERFNANWLAGDPAPVRYMDLLDPSNRDFDVSYVKNYDPELKKLDSYSDEYKQELDSILVSTDRLYKIAERSYKSWWEKSLSAISLRKNHIYLLEDYLIRMGVRLNFEQRLKAVESVVFVED